MGLSRPSTPYPMKTSKRPEHEARDAQGRSAPDDHRFPGHQQYDSKPKQAMDQRCEPGRDRSACGEGRAAGHRGADKDYQQCHIGAAARTP